MEWNEDKQAILEGLKNRTIRVQLNDLSENLRDDKEVVLALIQNDGRNFKDASDRLKKDKEVVLAALERYPLSFEYADKTMKNDKEIVQAALKEDWRLLKYASQELKNDKEIVEEAIGYNGKAIAYASQELKKDQQLVLKAITSNPIALEYASGDLKGNKDFMMMAVNSNGRTLHYASEKLKNDKEFMLELAKKDLDVLYCASDELKNDKPFMLDVFKNTWDLDVAVESKEKIVDEIVKRMRYASTELQNDEEFRNTVIDRVKNGFDKTKDQKTELIEKINNARQEGKELDAKIQELQAIKNRKSPYSQYETKQETYKRKRIINPEYVQQMQNEEKNEENTLDEETNKETVESQKEAFNARIKVDMNQNKNKITFESAKEENIINDYIRDEER